MTTRIKYHKSGKNYTSNYLTNYEGKRFLVMIHYYIVDNGFYRTMILNESGDVVDSVVEMSSSSAKRTARQLLINKYNVRLNEEIRPRG